MYSPLWFPAQNQETWGMSLSLNSCRANKRRQKQLCLNTWRRRETFPRHRASFLNEDEHRTQVFLWWIFCDNYLWVFRYRNRLLRPQDKVRIISNEAMTAAEVAKAGGMGKLLEEETINGINAIWKWWRAAGEARREIGTHRGMKHSPDFIVNFGSVSKL